MTGEELIQQFEEGTTPLVGFHHADHVRMAFEYLDRYAPLVALEKFSSALQRLAARHGKANLYHETITWAYLLLIRERMARAEVRQAWDEFAAENGDLLVGKGGILERHYCRETLDSELARRVFVFPDALRHG